jgi:hypothetical protein
MMLATIKKAWVSVKELSKSNGPSYIYRIVKIAKNEKGQYSTIVQVVGKSAHFEMKPEKILADDRLTAAFSPLDIRLLTYLGYCGIHTPQYKILAKKMMADEKIQFAVYDNKADEVIVLDHSKAQAIDEKMIKSLTSEDAYDLGYANGRQSILEEKQLLQGVK